MSIDYLRNRTVLVTGAAGTIGSALCEVLVPHVKALRALDHSENELFYLEQRLGKKGHFAPFLGDVRDLDRLRFAVSGVDVILHTAALKHVGLGEYNPFEVVQTNLQGVNNIVRAALDANTDRVIFTSSDKAVNPTNVMGASKMMGERLITAANQIRGQKRTRFASVRFGNVIGSRGSVVPVFAGQLLRGEPLTLTDEGMTRYIMSVKEAAALVLEAGARMRGAEVFVAKMHAMRVVDLAHVMAELITREPPRFVITGPRAGEKQFEELIAADEIGHSLDDGRLLVILPTGYELLQDVATRAAYPNGKPVDKEWNSSKDRAMTREELRAFLEEHQVLEPFRRGGLG